MAKHTRHTCVQMCTVTLSVIMGLYIGYFDKLKSTQTYHFFSEYEHGHYEYGHYDDDTRYGCYCDDYYDYNYHEEVASYASTLSPNASADFRSSLPSTTRPCRMICVDPAPYYYSNYGLVSEVFFAALTLKVLY